MKHFRLYWYFYVIAFFFLLIILPGNLPTIENIFQDAASHANLLGAVIGAFLAGLVAIYIVYKQDYAAKEKDAEQKLKNKISFLKSIKAELSSLKNRYMDIIGKQVLEHDEEKIFLNGLIDSNQNYFIFFDNNSHEIGLFNEPEESKLVSKIIRVYLDIKALFDRWISYDKKTDFWKYELSSYSSLPKEDAVQYRQYISDELRFFFKDIKSDQNRISESIEALLKDITKVETYLENNLKRQ